MEAVQAVKQLGKDLEQGLHLVEISGGSRSRDEIVLLLFLLLEIV